MITMPRWLTIEFLPIPLILGAEIFWNTDTQRDWRHEGDAPNPPHVCHITLSFFVSVSITKTREIFLFLPFSFVFHFFCVILQRENRKTRLWANWCSSFILSCPYSLQTLQRTDGIFMSWNGEARSRIVEILLPKYGLKKRGLQYV